MRAIYCTVPALVSYIYMNWYFREASVAVYVTMLPAIWSLMRDIFPGLRSTVSGGRSSAYAVSGKKHGTHPSANRWGHSQQQSGLRSGDHHHLHEAQKYRPDVRTNEVELSHYGSDDISADDCSTTSMHANAAEIRRDVTVTVEYRQGEPQEQLHRPAFD